MPIQKNAKQLLDQQVEDWEASSKPQSFQVPAATYICDLDSGGLETTKANAEGEVSVMGILVFISKSPLEGRQLRVSRFLSSKNKKGENYGVGQFLDECDVVLANAGEKSVDRSSIDSSDALAELIERIVKLGPTDVPIIADMPEKSKNGKMYQNLHVGLPGMAAANGQAGPKLPSVGDEVEYDGKKWKVTEVDDAGVTIKSGRAVKSITFEDLAGG